MIQYLRRANQKGASIYIFGCGDSGNKVFITLVTSGIIVKGFFDNAYPEGGIWQNRKILSLSLLVNCDKENTYVIIASSAIKQISCQLAEIGISNILNMKDLAIEYRSDFPVIKFNTSNHPKVSILITAYNEWLYTYNCLYSLSEHKIQMPYEIIFGEDVSTDMSKIAEQYFHGVKIVHNKTRMNYLGNANNIAKLAKGEYIVLLANDTVIIQDYWIDKMLEMMNKNNSIGMISGKYWTPSVGKYDVAFNYGDNWEEIRLDQDDNNMQVVDFVLPVASMIRKSVWEEVGGFSEEFLPAFREDNDLCMKIISSGYKCVYMPEIETIHFGSISYEKNEDCQYLLNRNHKLFMNKWNDYKIKK